MRFQLQRVVEEVWLPVAAPAAAQVVPAAVLSGSRASGLRYQELRRVQVGLESRWATATPGVLRLSYSPLGYLRLEQLRLEYSSWPYLQQRGALEEWLRAVWDPLQTMHSAQAGRRVWMPSQFWLPLKLFVQARPSESQNPPAILSKSSAWLILAGIARALVRVAPLCPRVVRSNAAL
jgi:hypothetical protein